MAKHNKARDERAIDAETFDALFDSGQDVIRYLDLSTLRRPNLERRRRRPQDKRS